MNFPKKATILLLALSIIFIAACQTKDITGNAICDLDAPCNDQLKEISIPISELSKQAVFHTFNDNGVEINFITVLGSDGKPRVAFDACDVCGGYKGYRQEGNDLVCNNCGRHFSIDGLGEKNQGYGCWPSYLPSEVQGENLIIKATDLKDGKFRFV